MCVGGGGWGEGGRNRASTVAPLPLPPPNLLKLHQLVQKLLLVLGGPLPTPLA